MEADKKCQMRGKEYSYREMSANGEKGRQKNVIKNKKDIWQEWQQEQRVKERACSTDTCRSASR